MPEPAADVPADASRDRRSVVWAKRVALVVVVLLAFYAVYRNYEALRDDLDRLSPAVIAASFVPAVLAMLVSLQVWRVLMAELGAPLPFGAAARVFYISQLGKYVPGTMWSVMAQMELGREFKVPRRTSAAVGVLVLAVAVVAGTTVAVLLLPLAGEDIARRYWWLVLVLPLLYVGVHPPVLGWVLTRLLKLIGREPITTLPTWPALRRALLLQAVTWLLFGLQVWLLVTGLGAPVLASLPAAVGGYALAYSLGMLAFLLPAGAGIREGTLVLALAGVVTGSTALLVALLARAIATVCDLVFALVEMVRWRAQRKPVSTLGQSNSGRDD
ncbi:lysylphosphatidylglycerol synthase domain-containing protein [Nocardioides sp. CER19]|uniref:lysylphosphatidylglycerol synthase domain-containing protein n=1 Tax=Nocardioides sp. CER19 TaxID=3038538 RepID=UPI00244A71B9|nr:lysylphosphatidylglycerol synthase domain-containing protein [Nocardioides sp. CER19]MDH2416941.1 lysylphosphatidylglycerol synthase domain-containing protein [Nocardioides sp. CER19]